MLDGGLGTELIAKMPTTDDFGGASMEGCMEILNERRTDWIRQIHASYLEAGADAIETNTFGANAVVLGKFGLAHRVEEINEFATRLALDVARSYDDGRYVIGSIGPGTKLLSLAQVEPDFMFDSYRVQTRGLLRGGSDAILIETCQDLAQVKTAVRAAKAAMRETQLQRPIWVSITVESNGTMLLGTDLGAVIASMDGLGIDMLGLNCGLGPFEMQTALAVLHERSPFPILCQPNAGLPVNRDGNLVYDLDPDAFGEKLAELCQLYSLQMVGGCCGTEPSHIRALKQHMAKLPHQERQAACYEPSISSLYQSVSLQQEIRPLIVGERANANGSKAFRELLAKSDFDAMTTLAKDQQKSGAHLLDICVAFAGRDEAEDMDELLKKLILQSQLPLMIDSTEVPVIERALKRAPGRCIVNSINLEDGGTRAGQVLELCREFGACVVGLCIDECGMAKTLDDKKKIAARLVDLAVGKYGLAPSHLMIDPLTFTLATGEESYRNSAQQTLQAIREIKAAHPGVLTVLGVSNVSFGLKEGLRQALNAMMLYHAVKEGLDLAIFNSAKVMPITKIPEEIRHTAEDLIFNRRSADYDPLKILLASVGQNNAQENQEDPDPISRLRHDVMEGRKAQVAADLEEVLKLMAPVDILNGVLLGAMKEVGDRFRSGLMQLPFVLESAEVMREAVEQLEPHLPKADGQSKGRVVLATVKGDVHDIGKNLVGIILKNNGYEVDDLGVQQDAPSIAAALNRSPAVALGLSGLLVKSTQIMQENLAYLEEQGFNLPVILGGAALTRDFVEKHCAPVYSGNVHYAETAFDGLKHLERSENAVIVSTSSSDAKVHGNHPPITSLSRAAKDDFHGQEEKIEITVALDEYGRSSFVETQSATLDAPFWGIRDADMEMGELFEWLDEFVVIRNRWAFTKGKLDEDVFQKLLHEEARPKLDKWKRILMDSGMKARARYGYVPVKAQGDSLEILDVPQCQSGYTLNFPRQKSGRRLCIADFFSHESRDVMGLQAVTLGQPAVDWARELFEENRYADYFIFHGLMTELCEAGAERLHARIRKELGISIKDGSDIRHIARHEYQGARYSFGYPACPDLTGNRTILELLNGQAMGITLSETLQMHPEYSTCAMVSPHPQAVYFMA